MSNVKESNTLPSIQLIDNRGWKTVEVNGKEKLIPDSWKVENIGETIDFKLGSTPPKTGSHYNGDTPWVTISNISGPITTSWTAKIDYEKARVLPKGSLIGSFKMTVGRFSILGMDASTNEAIVGVSPDGAPGFSFDYLRFALVEPFVSGASTNGQGVQLLNTKTIKSLCFVSPPFDEQTLIAQVLTAQESQVHDLRKLAALERQRLSWLSDELLSGRLRVEEDPTAGSVVVSRNEKGEPVEVLPGVRVVENRKWKTVEVNGKEKLIPDEWMVKNVGESIDFKLGNTPPKTGSNYDGNTPWVTISNISGALTTSCTAKIDYEKARVLPKGSLIGSFKMSVGRFSILGMDAATNEAIVGVSPDGAPGFSFDYLRFALVEPFVGGASTNGQGVHLLNTKTIKSLSFVAPPLPEQTLIAQFLTAQETQASELERLADLEQKRLEWLSDELLSGRIRVKPVSDENNQEPSP